MKKVFGILTAFLLALLLVGLIILKLFHSPSSPKQAAVNAFPVSPSSQSILNDTPYHTALTCYTWYVQALVRGAQYQTFQDQPQASQCFSHEFMNSWKSIVESGDANPVLYTQDIGNSWVSNISVRVVGQSIRSADVQIDIGTGNEHVPSIAHLVQEQDGTWRIISTSNPDLKGGTQ